jgi:site-specific recombinase XerD
MDRAIRTFLDVLAVQQARPPQTIRAYASDLAQFHAFALGVHSLVGRWSRIGRRLL